MYKVIAGIPSNQGFYSYEKNYLVDYLKKNIPFIGSDQRQALASTFLSLYHDAHRHSIEVVENLRPYYQNPQADGQAILAHLGGFYTYNTHSPQFSYHCNIKESADPSRSYKGYEYKSGTKRYLVLVLDALQKRTLILNQKWDITTPSHKTATYEKKIQQHMPGFIFTPSEGCLTLTQDTLHLALNAQTFEGYLKEYGSAFFLRNLKLPEPKLAKPDRSSGSTSSARLIGSLNEVFQALSIHTITSPTSQDVALFVQEFIKKTIHQNLRINHVKNNKFRKIEPAQHHKRQMETYFLEFQKALHQVIPMIQERLSSSTKILTVYHDRSTFISTRHLSSKLHQWLHATTTQIESKPHLLAAFDKVKQAYAQAEDHYDQHEKTLKIFQKIYWKKIEKTLEELEKKLGELPHLSTPSSNPSLADQLDACQRYIKNSEPQDLETLSLTLNSSSLIYLYLDSDSQTMLKSVHSKKIEPLLITTAVEDTKKTEGSSKTTPTVSPTSKLPVRSEPPVPLVLYMLGALLGGMGLYLLLPFVKKVSFQENMSPTPISPSDNQKLSLKKFENFFGIGPLTVISANLTDIKVQNTKQVIWDIHGLQSLKKDIVSIERYSKLSPNGNPEIATNAHLLLNQRCFTAKDYLIQNQGHAVIYKEFKKCPNKNGSYQYRYTVLDSGKLSSIDFQLPFIFYAHTPIPSML